MVGEGAPIGPLTFLRVLHFSQVYPWQKIPAVDRLCLGIPPGEVSLE